MLMFPLVDHVLHGALRPLVRIWTAKANDGLAQVPRPTDAPRAHTMGLDSDRVLILGAGPAVGYGVSSHELALPGSLARALTARTGRGTNVNVISDPGLDISNTRDTLEAALLWRYDAIVLTLGVKDALAFTPIRAWEKHLTGLLAEISALAPPRMEMFVVGIQPIRSIPGFDSPMGGLVDGHARVMNRVSAVVCSRRSQVTFVPLSALPGQQGRRYRSPSDYTLWGRELAVTIAPILDSGWRAATSGMRYDSSSVVEAAVIARQRSVEELKLAGGGTHRRLDHVVNTARRVFGTQIAGFTVIDDDRLLLFARTGTDLIHVPLSDSFSDIAVGSRDGVVIPDARQDSRFSNNALVLGDRRIRFFAGYPIESPTSRERIGALCVLDPEPRAAADVDLSLLRELALLIQRELWLASMNPNWTDNDAVMPRQSNGYALKIMRFIAMS
jgi:lysophospholipase L1-like esterase